MTELKTLKDLEFEQVTDVRPDGYEGNVPFRKKIVKRKCVFSYLLKAEAIKWVKHFYNPDKTTMEIKEWLHFFNITEEELTGEDK